MANSVSYTKDDALLVINAEQVCYCVFNKDGTVSIQFSGGEIMKFVDMNDREKEALQRALRINPA